MRIGDSGVVKTAAMLAGSFVVGDTVKAPIKSFDLPSRPVPVQSAPSSTIRPPFVKFGDLLVADMKKEEEKEPMKVEFSGASGGWKGTTGWFSANVRNNTDKPMIVTASLEVTNIEPEEAKEMWTIGNNDQAIVIPPNSMVNVAYLTNNPDGGNKATTQLVIKDGDGKVIVKSDTHQLNPSGPRGNGSSPPILTGNSHRQDFPEKELAKESIKTTQHILFWNEDGTGATYEKGGGNKDAQTADFTVVVTGLEVPKDSKVKLDDLVSSKEVPVTIKRLGAGVADIQIELPKGLKAGDYKFKYEIRRDLGDEAVNKNHKREGTFTIRITEPPKEEKKN